MACERLGLAEEHMKTLWIACALLIVSVRVAAAGPGGLNLGWNECGGMPATLNRTFACNTNLGFNTLVGSFVTPCCVTAMSANEVVMNLQSASPTWPSWWDLRTGMCRPGGSLFASVDFTAGPFTCLDYWEAVAVSGILMDQVAGNRSRIRIIAALPAGDPRIRPIEEGTEVYAFKVTVTNAKSVGGACPGCLTPVCIVLNSININQPVGEPGRNKFVSMPAMRNYANWQGGISGDCYMATPARSTTWGSVKALYR
jgi:hypothetical protein